MAICRPSPLITSISGPIGGSQFVSTSKGLRIRNRPSRRPTPTQSSIAARADHVALRAQWAALPTDDKLYYQQLALQLTSSDRLAQKTKPSPFEAWIAYWSYWNRFTASAASSHPRARWTDQPTSLDLGFVSPATYNIRVQHALPAGTVYCGLYAAVSFRSFPPRASQPHIYIATITNAVTFVNIFVEWSKVLPVLELGQHYSVRCIALRHAYFPAAPVFGTAVLVI